MRKPRQPQKKQEDVILEKAVRHFLALDPSHIVTHGEIEKLAKLDYPKSSDFENDEEFREAIKLHGFAYMTFTENLKKELLTQHQICLKNERGVGYYILHPKEQIRYGIDRTKRGVRKKIKQGSDIIIHVQYNQVSVSDRKAANDGLAAMSRARQMINDFNLK